MNVANHQPLVREGGLFTQHSYLYAENQYVKNREALSTLMPS